MRVIIEGYKYVAADVKDVLQGLNTLENVSHEICVCYVGYYYNPELRDCVFFLPKVLLNDQDLVFSHLEPREIIHMDKAMGLTNEERNFIYEFAVWIYRAISEFNRQNPKNNIVYHRLITEMGGSHKFLSNTFLDVLLSILRFNRENQHFFTFVLRNLHSGANKINWTQTISNSPAVVQGNDAFYLNPVNKKRQINFDEELLVIFFSILHYVHETYGFPIYLNIGFDLITGKKFDHYIKGFGKARLKQIKYKYFSDKALRMWELCFVFFDKSRRIAIMSEQREYLLAKNFNIIFEAIIDDLIGDKDIPVGLRKQEDGKRVDHMFTSKGLITHEQGQSIYYIGDSKYYKIGNKITKESVYKQYTYARNVIQWNLNLFMDGRQRQIDVKLRDDVTEGYNIIPNFFISAKMDEKLSYADTISCTDRETKSFISRQFENRLFDRDTLLIFHYDVNFLYVVSLYARRNEHQKAKWKEKVRNMFRLQIQKMLQEKYDFYAMMAHPDVNAEKYIKEHFQEVLGKIYTPYSNNQIYSLALEKKDPEGNNDTLLTELRRFFFIKECALGCDPAFVLLEASKQGVEPSSLQKNGVLLVMMENYEQKSQSFLPFEKIAVGIKYTKDSMEIIEHLSDIGYVLFHIRKDEEQHLFPVVGDLVVKSKHEIDCETYKNVSTAELYVQVQFNSIELNSQSFHSSKRGYSSKKYRYDAQYATIDKLK